MYLFLIVIALVIRNKTTEIELHLKGLYKKHKSISLSHHFVTMTK